MSIEELLASNGEPSSLLDDELMSMWIAAPMDIE
jgi:hypothetical protein